MLRVLFLCDDREDYLADSLLHGLISLGSHQVVDYPKKEILYASSVTADQLKELHGNGFTLYGLLPERRVDRSLILNRLESGWFDLVILSNIWRQFGLLMQIVGPLEHGRTRVLLLDGDDDSRLYPMSLAKLKQHGLQIPGTLQKLSVRIWYAKRELDMEQPQHWRELLVPAKLRPQIRRLFKSQLLNPRPCSFSIPEQWIRHPNPNIKTKPLARHIVDAEVQSQLKTGQTSYAFCTQEQYYNDLARSKYGITTKRAGWDCLRHYEIAAAGTVPCFRNLKEKPKFCAPHGLSEDNCVMYTSAMDLHMQLQKIDWNEYTDLLMASHAWVKQHTTARAAERLLHECLA